MKWKSRELERLFMILNAILMKLGGKTYIKHPSPPPPSPHTHTLECIRGRMRVPIFPSGMSVKGGIFGAARKPGKWSVLGNC